MSDLKVKRIYGDEKFEKIFRMLIDEKINSIKIMIKQERDARYNNINYLSTNEKKVDENE